MEPVNCFFNERFIADGKPVIVNLHKKHEKDGVKYPGNTPVSNIKIGIPRSKYAKKVHSVGRAIKIVALIMSIFFFLYGYTSRINYIVVMLLIAGTILLGGILCYVFYRYLEVKSKYSGTNQFPGIKEYESKGYHIGFHPLFSTGPFEYLYKFYRLIF